VLAASAAAVAAGARSVTAIAEWATDAPWPILATLGVRRDPLTRRCHVPGEATIRRVLARVDGDAVDATIGAWLADRLHPPRHRHATAASSRSTARPCGARPTRCTCWLRCSGEIAADRVLHVQRFTLPPGLNTAPQLCLGRRPPPATVLASEYHPPPALDDVAELPRSRGANAYDKHGGPDEHQCNSDPDEGCQGTPPFAFHAPK
jgi:hypothetical protein